MTIILGDTLIMPMSKSIKVSVKSELPLTGEENEIVLISEVQTENFFISNSEPTASEDDVWIVSGEEGEHSIQFGKDSKSKIILLGAQQKTEDGWSKLDGYVWLSGEWARFSTSEPKGFEFLTCITTTQEWTPPEDGFYRINVFGKCANGESAEGGSVGDNYSFYGGDGGASGGFARSLLSLTTQDRINCTVTNALTSFGDYLSATGATGATRVGKGSGGNLANLDGFPGGFGGRPASYGDYNAAPGKRGGNSGASGGPALNDGWGGGGGGGGGARIPVPEVDYDDPLYTTYTVTTLSNYHGGTGSVGHTSRSNGSGTPGSSYPAFNPLSPVIYGGGNGGGGGNNDDESSRYAHAGGRGSAGSPACIIIEKAIY